jgi:hypothetical protein
VRESKRRKNGHRLYPPEAPGDGNETPLDVIAVDASEAELERYLAAYEHRYRAACKAFDAWDDLTKDWGAEHDRECYELRRRYQVYGGLITGTKFKILRCRSGGRPASEREAPASPKVHG